MIVVVLLLFFVRSIEPSTFPAHTLFLNLSSANQKSSTTMSSAALDTNAPVEPPPPGAFANMLVGKRRRMRTVSAGQKEVPAGAVVSTTAKPDKKKTKGKKGKQQEGSCNPNVPANTAIPIFLKSESLLSRRPSALREGFRSRLAQDTTARRLPSSRVSIGSSLCASYLKEKKFLCPYLAQIDS